MQYLVCYHIYGYSVFVSFEAPGTYKIVPPSILYIGSKHEIEYAHTDTIVIINCRKRKEQMQGNSFPPLSRPC